MKKFFKGFSLIEIVVAIVVITLCIISLISTYYSIYKLQNQTMYSSLLKRKIETRFFTQIYPKIDLYITNGNIYNTIRDILTKLQNDPDLMNSIQITEINFTPNDPTINLPRFDLSKEDSSYKYNAKKYISKITIKYRIIKNNKENQIEVYFPTITQGKTPLPTNPPDGNSNNSTTTENTNSASTSAIF